MTVVRSMNMDDMLFPRVVHRIESQPFAMEKDGRKKIKTCHLKKLGGNREYCKDFQPDREKGVAGWLIAAGHALTQSE